MLLNSYDDLQQFLKDNELTCLNLPVEFVEKGNYPAYGIITNRAIFLVPPSVWNNHIDRRLKGLGFWKRVQFGLLTLFKKDKLAERFINPAQ